uniref:Uncharacterized protein n=1 Tax=Corvus moneduloides TaxID=1196302 RepID=A0A8C3GUT2_CORMO
PCWPPQSPLLMSITTRWMVLRPGLVSATFIAMDPNPHAHGRSVPSSLQELLLFEHCHCCCHMYLGGTGCVWQILGSKHGQLVIDPAGSVPANTSVGHKEKVPGKAPRLSLPSTANQQRHPP